jgi:hypothetical protein
MREHRAQAAVLEAATGIGSGTAHLRRSRGAGLGATLTSQEVDDVAERLAMAHSTSAASLHNSEASAASVASGIIITGVDDGTPFRHLAAAARRGSRVSISGMPPGVADSADHRQRAQAHARGTQRAAVASTHRGAAVKRGTALADEHPDSLVSLAVTAMAASRLRGPSRGGRGGSPTSSSSPRKFDSRAVSKNTGYRYYTQAADPDERQPAPGAPAAGGAAGVSEAHAGRTLRYQSPLEKAHADIVAAWNRRAAETMEEVVAASYNNGFDAPFTALPSFWPAGLPRRTAGEGEAGAGVAGSVGGRGATASSRARPAQTYAQVLGEAQ